MCVFKRLGMLLLALIVQGCAVVESKRVASNAASDDGLVYYLPTRPLKVEVTRAEVPTKPEVDKAKAAESAAEAAFESAKNILEVATERMKATKAATPARAEAEKNVNLAEADVVVASKKLAARSKKVAEVEADYAKALDGNPPLTDTLTFTLLPSVADTRHRYVANLNHLVTRSDKLELKTTTAGLLSSSAAKSEDQTAQILVSLAQTVAAVAGPVPIGPITTMGLGWPLGVIAEPPVVEQPPLDCGNGFKRSAAAELKPFKFEYVFDPTRNVIQAVSIKDKLSPVELSPWAYLQSSLCALGADYLFDWKSMGPNVASDIPAEKDNKLWEGLFYRRQLPYRLDVYKITTAEQKSSPILSKSLYFELPNASPPELLKIKGSLFASREFGAEFTDGLLVANKEVKPSEALAVVALPYDITKALISVPAEIIQLKVDYSSKAQSLVDAQIKYQDTLKAISDKQKSPSAFEEQTKALEQEKSLLQLQKDIADLKASIAKLETK